MPVCVVYARVSTEDQARHGFSLGAQVRECADRARALGYAPEEVQVLADEGYSGDAVDRPGLNRLRDLVAEPGRVGHVVILDPDRFARSLSLQLIVTEEIIRSGAALEFLNFEWQDTPEGKLFYSLRGAISEYEKAKIRERTRRGREQKARQGLLPVGKSLYGYRFDPVTDQLEPVEAEQAVLRLMRNLMLDGAPGSGERLSAVQVARWLARQGIPAPKGARWYASTVARIVRNEAYTGTYRVLGGQYAISIPPVWDHLTHRALCERLASNRLTKGQRRSSEPYLLTGLLRCGLCGRKMKGHAVRDARRDYRYYICSRSPAFEANGGMRVRCAARHWPAAPVDDRAWAVVRQHLMAADLRPERSDRRNQEKAAVLQALAQREKELDRYLRLFASGQIADEDRLRALYQPAREAADRLRGRLVQLETAPAPARPPDLASLPPGARREVVRLLIRSVVIDEESMQVHLPVCHAKPGPVRQLER